MQKCLAHPDAGGGTTIDKLDAVAIALGVLPAVFLIDDPALATVINRLAQEPQAVADVQFAQSVLAPGLRRRYCPPLMGASPSLSGRNRSADQTSSTATCLVELCAPGSRSRFASGLRASAIMDCPPPLSCSSDRVE